MTVPPFLDLNHRSHSFSPLVKGEGGYLAGRRGALLPPKLSFPLPRDRERSLPLGFSPFSFAFRLRTFRLFKRIFLDFSLLQEFRLVFTGPLAIFSSTRGSSRV